MKTTQACKLAKDLAHRNPNAEYHVRATIDKDSAIVVRRGQKGVLTHVIEGTTLFTTFGPVGVTG